MRLETFFTILFALVVSCKLLDCLLLWTQQGNHQQDSPVQTKHVTHQTKLKVPSSTLVPVNNTNHQTKPKIDAPAPLVSMILAWLQSKKKVARPVLQKQAYAIPRYTQAKLPNGQQGIKLTDIHHYYTIRII